MHERIRRGLIFVTIVGAGTLLILFDLPLLLILPLIMLIGLVLLILLGAISPADIKALRSSLGSRGKKGADATTGTKPQGAQPSPVQDTTREKKVSFSLGTLLKGRAGTPAPSGATAAQQQLPPAAGKKKAASPHLSSLVSSLRAFGTMLTARKKADPDKLKKIDSMLDLTVSGKIDTQAPVKGGLPDTDTALSSAQGGAGGPGGAPLLRSTETAEEDPFLSLSNDELESGLLDDLDEEPAPSQPAVPAGEAPMFSVQVPDEGQGIPIGGPDMPLPPQDLSSAASDILKENEPELADLPALEGIESVDENLGELDNLNLDAVDLDEEPEEEEDLRAASPVTAASAGIPVAAVSAAPGSAPAGAPAVPDKTAARSDQTDMSAFAAPSASDDMLSSLASDIKTVKKQADLSLLRDLRDFRAPGKTLENELSDLYTSLNTATEKLRKLKPAPAKKQKTR